ncbi:type IV toxin-antitoxin system AbiEi family antitoxin domain-containing protein [Kineosporia babensis]|uniref:Type IV toxin-antitoxin system AbiEi family antitoxin domain-containing protein n=1 Tax=Kineosporia babensis TaxID=499548 RepID=A0A9X1SWK6_9ACTN|nr:type IV toxin-antitoxin system AbiEi family antitoxin domain-containing protein [Kineosporia babensis]MCD5314876.1 type IV toxin-antitoxin system AbiEi family antitoxin domain-containing protein [Kineosporia babensis]
MSESATARLGALAERRWGLVTTAQAESVGVTRKQLSRMASVGVLERVAQGVYRMAGAPTARHEAIYASWLALGGATAPKTEASVAAVVAAGTTATVVHAVGDFVPNGFDFIVPRRKGTRLAGVRLRVRSLAADEVIPVDGLPTLTVERTIADLLDLDTDFSLVADAVREAVRSDKLVAPDRLVEHLSVAAARPKVLARELVHDLFEIAGAWPEGWHRG